MYHISCDKIVSSFVLLVGKSKDDVFDKWKYEVLKSTLMLFIITVNLQDSVNRDQKRQTTSSPLPMAPFTNMD